MKEKIETWAVEWIADMIIVTVDYAADLGRSLLCIILTSLSAWVLLGVLGHDFGFGQVLGIAVVLRLLIGPPVIRVEPELTDEEKALLVRAGTEENDGPSLRVVPDPEDM